MFPPKADPPPEDKCLSRFCHLDFWLPLAYFGTIWILNFVWVLWIYLPPLYTFMRLPLVYSSDSVLSIIISFASSGKDLFQKGRNVTSARVMLGNSARTAVRSLFLTARSLFCNCSVLNSQTRYGDPLSVNENCVSSSGLKFTLSIILKSSSRIFSTVMRAPSSAYES